MDDSDKPKPTDFVRPDSKPTLVRMVAYMSPAQPEMTAEGVRKVTGGYYYYRFERNKDGC